MFHPFPNEWVKMSARERKLQSQLFCKIFTAKTIFPFTFLAIAGNEVYIFFLQILRMIFPKFWDWFSFILLQFPNFRYDFFHSLHCSRILGLGLSFSSCSGIWECFLIPSCSQIARKESSIPAPVPELIRVILAHPWVASTLHCIWEETDVERISGTTTIARSTTMGALSKLATQKEMTREKITLIF